MKIKNNVETKFLNIEDEEVTVKLPKHYKILRNEVLEPKYNLGIEVSEDKPFNAEQFGEVLYTVTDTEIRNFEIEEPTNLFYLNAYFDIIKTKNISLPDEEMIITTEKLKEMIADLLGIEKERLGLEEIYNILLSSKSTEQKRIKTNKKPKEIEDSVKLAGDKIIRQGELVEQAIENQENLKISIEDLKAVDRKRREEYRRRKK